MVLAGQDDSKAVVCRRKSRIASQSFFHLGLSILPSPLIEVKMAEVVVGLGIDGPRPYGSSILLRGPGQFALLYQQSGQIVVCFRQIGVFTNHMPVLFASRLRI